MSSSCEDHNHSVDWVDRAGIWLSVLCLVHCALTPVVLLLLPALVYGGDGMHVALAVLLPVFAFAAFVPGFRQHGAWSVLAGGAVGLSFIISALWAKSLRVEIALTVTGSLFLIGAHLTNRRLKNKHCEIPKAPA